jgi:hypothetical protein
LEGDHRGIESLIAEPKRRNKVASIMVRGHCVIGAVFDVKGEDNIGEFDPFFVERIKNCM